MKKVTKRYELPDEMKDMMDLASVLNRKIGDFHDKEMSRYNLSRNEVSEKIRPLFDASWLMARVIECLKNYSGTLIGDCMYDRQSVILSSLKKK